MSFRHVSGRSVMAALALTATISATDVLASPGHSVPFGAPAAAEQATRTITIVMRDNLFEPEAISITAGEIVRFVVINEGEFLHEFNLGTAEMHAKHQEEMAMMVDHGVLTPTGMNHNAAHMDHSKHGMSMDEMKHDDPNSVLVEPGATGELVWHFTKAMELEFACNIPGHYESGMAGPIEFTK